MTLKTQKMLNLHAPSPSVAAYGKYSVIPHHHDLLSLFNNSGVISSCLTIRSYQVNLLFHIDSWKLTKHTQDMHFEPCINIK